MAIAQGVLTLKQPSESLTLAIKECASGFRHLRDNINNAIEIGLAEGFSSKEVSTMIRHELAKNAEISDRQIRRYLPSDLKDKSKVRLRSYVSAKTITEMDFSTLQEQDLTRFSKSQLIDIIKRFLHSNSLPMGNDSEKIHGTPITTMIDKDKEKQVIGLHNQGKSVREIAAIVGKSVSATQRIITKAKKK